MHFLIILTATTPLMALLLTEAVTSRETNCSDPACKTPSQPLFEDIGSDNVTILYIYNETSQLCEDVLIDKHRNNTFKYLFECASRCKTGQGNEECVGEPVSACNNSGVKNNLASTSKTLCGSENGSQDTQDGEHFTEDDDPYEAYFYNLTSKECQDYLACGYPDRSKVKNFFMLKNVCEEECRGFDLSNIYGNKSNRTI
ncbi:uncharacterized protein LOC125946624 isoform X2 [Dermacentor silvarum]|uniref:uncharacterized protein LOC125946624 isoform X2 n=1 Tax=Dermacentor silvarum TaxID=543639 RepID=UPI002100B16F|nr:uncharacterized protein LOC125946624 isoform X2 [Dermacentor silvarum]